ASKPEECRRQLEYLPFKTVGFRSSPGAYLRAAVEQGFGAPPGFVEAKQREVRAVQAEARQKAEVARREAERERVGGWLSRMEIEAPAAFSAFLDYYESEKRRALNGWRQTPRIVETIRASWERPEKRSEAFCCYFRDHPCPIPELAEW